MSWTLQQAVDRIVAEGVDETEAAQIANQRHNELITRSGFQRKLVSLGSTVADTSTYDVPGTIARVRSLYIEETDGTIVRYPERIGEDDMLAIRAGEASGSYLYAQSFGTDGQLKVDLEPAPDTSGYTVWVMAECVPGDLVLSDLLQIPDQFVQGLLDGIRAVIYAEQDEQLGEASAWTQSFESTVEKLRRYMNARVVGDGPIVIPMRGLNWR